jgi:hypothetical protein
MKFTDLINGQPISIRVKAEESCPKATQDIAVNLANRGKAIKTAMYGPLNPSEPNTEYWGKLAKEWDVDNASAKKQLCGNCSLFIQTPSMKDCINKGVTGGDRQDEWEAIDSAGELGYCEAFDFKCASKRTCRAWVAGGPIVKEKSLGRTFGTLTRAANTGRPSYDGDGDGKYTNPVTGRDDVPFRAPNTPAPKKQGSFELKPRPANGDPKENRFDGQDSKEVFERFNEANTWIKKARKYLNGEGPAPRNFEQAPGNAPGLSQQRTRTHLKETLEEIQKIKESLKKRGYDDPEEARLEYGRGKKTQKSLRDPEGGLTAAGRAHFNRTEGSNLKPGVKGPADTPEKMRRKGSFLTRFFTNPSGPMKDEKGRPTRLALSAAAWGEPVPQNADDARELAAKGKRMLERYKNSKDKD